MNTKGCAARSTLFSSSAGCRRPVLAPSAKSLDNKGQPRTEVDSITTTSDHWIALGAIAQILRNGDADHAAVLIGTKLTLIDSATDGLRRGYPVWPLRDVDACRTAASECSWPGADRRTIVIGASLSGISALCLLAKELPEICTYHRFSVFSRSTVTDPAQRGSTGRLRHLRSPRETG